MQESVFNPGVPDGPGAEIISLCQAASSLACSIQTSEDAEAGFRILSEVTSVRKRIKEEFEPMLRAARDSLERIRASYKKHDEPLERVELHLRAALAEFRRAEAERLKAKALKEAEMARQAIEERTEAILNSLTQDVATPEMIRAICDQADREIAATMAAAKPPKPKVSGGSFRETWKAEVVDVVAVAKAVANGKAPASLISVNMTEANRMAASHREELSRFVPGLVAKRHVVVATRHSGGAA